MSVNTGNYLPVSAARNASSPNSQNLMGRGIETRKFDASIFGTYEKLENFFSQSRAIRDILSEGKRCLYNPPSPLEFDDANAMNRPNKEGMIVHQTPFIPENEITDRKVKKRTYCALQGGVKFDHPACCQGMSDWFVYLYLKTEHGFSNPRSHMCVLGEQFNYGSGTEPTLLETIYLAKGKLLGLKIGMQSVGSHGSGRIPIFKCNTDDWTSSNIEKLENLPRHVYRINVPLHAMAYLKINENQSFFFDPNEGIKELSSNRDLYQLVTTCLEESGGDVPDYKSGEGPNFIEVVPVTLR